MARNGNPKTSLESPLGLEAKLWQAAEYKHVVLGLLFLKYVSDSFEEHDARLTGEMDQGANPEDPDEYRADNIFWVPKEARWSFLQSNAKRPEIGKVIDDAMVAIERDNKSLKAVLPKDFARPGLDKQRLRELIDLVGTIGLGDKEHRSRDMLGQVYEYFLSRFASAEGKKGGQFYTPRSVVRVLALLFERIAGILESGCERVLRTINHETVRAYRLIGREIVQALQGGEARSEYGNALITDMSKHLTERYEAGFSVANLKNFRQFYLVYSDRSVSIGYPLGSQSAASDGLSPISSPAGSESPSVFYPNLSWSHCRSLMRVENIVDCLRPKLLFRGKCRRCSVLNDSQQLFSAKYQSPCPAKTSSSAKFCARGTDRKTNGIVRYEKNQSHK